MQSPLVSVGMGVQLVRLVEKGEFRVSEVAVLSLPDLAEYRIAHGHYLM